MSQRPPALSAEEQEQILQTIEMFEVIVQANPQDCQSMEILKDAYMRVGRIKETTAISRKLAETYIQLGQYSSALLEYEGMLKTDPDNPELDCRARRRRGAPAEERSDPQTKGGRLVLRLISIFRAAAKRRRHAHYDFADPQARHDACRAAAGGGCGIAQGGRE
jgi:tetratricopeptide (TPR) repeat protein